jgi:hypothetical protein
LSNQQPYKKRTEYPLLILMTFVLVMIFLIGIIRNSFELINNKSLKEYYILKQKEILQEFNLLIFISVLLTITCTLFLYLLINLLKCSIQNKLAFWKDILENKIEYRHTNLSGLNTTNLLNFNLKEVKSEEGIR